MENAQPDKTRAPEKRFLGTGLHTEREARVMLVIGGFGPASPRRAHRIPWQLQRPVLESGASGALSW